MNFYKDKQAKILIFQDKTQQKAILISNY